MASRAVPAAADDAPAAALLSSLAAFLSRVGYEKTLAALKCEAGVEESVWKSSSSINLEYLFKTYSSVSVKHADQSVSKVDQGLKSIHFKTDGIKEKKQSEKHDVSEKKTETDQKPLGLAEGSDSHQEIHQPESTRNDEKRSKKRKADKSISLEGKSHGHQENQSPDYNNDGEERRKKKTKHCLTNENSDLCGNGNIAVAVKHKIKELKSIMNEASEVQKDSKKKRPKALAQSDDSGSKCSEIPVTPKTDMVLVDNDHSQTKKDKKKRRSTSVVSPETVENGAPDNGAEGVMKKKKLKQSSKLSTLGTGNDVTDPITNDTEKTEASGKFTNGDKKATKNRKKSKEAGHGSELPVELDVTAHETEETIVAKKRLKKSKGENTLNKVMQTEDDDREDVSNNEVDNDSRRKNAKAECTGSMPRKKDKQSSEGKTSVPFKRVNVEEVEFVDERLQNNSYWAKDGADSGYGAKAQEILGQVRGRDFRHEKTKKKRGSYRGGIIDQASHSIKFNYSDEE